jgi:conjugal transfer pilus assembly protein TraB
LAVPPPFTSDAESTPAEPLVFKPEKTALTSPSDGPELEAKVRYKRNTQSGMMVAGAFAPVVLLNGLDAGTSSGSRSNPEPVLMRVQDHAVLPGSTKYQLRSCFLLGSGYGELSAERVYIRLARLSCVDRSDRLVLSVPVQGYVVDSDNTLGMRGKVVDRQGARLGKAMLAGFAQGLSSALGGAQGTVSSSVLGTATSVTGSEALRASGLSGASTAAGQLATFYLKEAQSIFPVITVQGGRTAVVVFTEDANLAWGGVDAQFVREVDPQGVPHGS